MIFKRLRYKYNNSFISKLLNRIGFININLNKTQYPYKFKKCYWCGNKYQVKLSDLKSKKEILSKIKEEKITPAQLSYLYKQFKPNKSYKHSYCSKTCQHIQNEEKFQVFKHNNQCKRHPFEKITYKNECWGCYKKKIVKNKDLRIKKLRGTFLLKYFFGFKLIPTFIEKDIANRIAFEQYLFDNGYKWFVYIKLYKDRRNFVRPLVVGKSGSMRVNQSGTDLNYSTRNQDGSSKKYLNSNGGKWHTSHILIKKCKSEYHAFKLEQKIFKYFDFFQS